LAHAPGDYHPDHRAASALAEAASWFAASGGYMPEQPPLQSQPALWWMDTINMSGFEPGFFVDVSNFADLKHQMLNCHKSQLAHDQPTPHPTSMLCIPRFRRPSPRSVSIRIGIVELTVLPTSSSTMGNRSRSMPSRSRSWSSILSVA